MTSRSRLLRATRVRVAVLMVVFFPLLWFGYQMRLQAGIDELESSAGQRLALLSASLDAELLRYESLPAVLAQHPGLRDVLAHPDDPQRVAFANRLLEQVNARTGAGMLYLIAPSGRTLAASNWQRPDSFVGENYAFRPYFKDALRGESGAFFAVGATTRVPGFFIAHAVLDDERVVGVLAVKVELALLEQTWAEGGESVVVVDRHGVVALSSRSDWKFATLAPLSAESRRALADTRQYFTERLAPLPLKWLDARRLRLNGKTFVVRQAPLDWVDWRMMIMLDSAQAVEAAWLQVLAAMLALCVMGVAVLYWAQRARRIRERLAAQDVLERTVAERTADLADTNAQLVREIGERTAAEQKLRGAQQALIEANRLAALGQMAAGVAHELNQPLAAMRAFAGNGLTFLERARYAPLGDNLRQMIGLVERMARLTAQLKVFASRQQTQGGSTAASQAVQTVAGWLAHRIETSAVDLRIDCEPVSLPLQPQALEQVLLNLLGNALDALDGRTDAKITIRVSGDGAERVLEVADNGPGIDASLIDKVAQPFFSTKPLGQGLGLGLAIVSDLVSGSGGRLAFHDRVGGGTVVRVSWPGGEAGRAEGAAREAET
ncbi:sensor histidine kinase [Azoarcus sp. L1K30]|uniref:ATP-binding protein n=1 Tax=Azoarcus sp. L1K30 TaxID=2820277 RepID=UPI001B83D903|nr:ATP-binding protein [Azoarcus sp. L1K30]MBR0566036.1 sensor histidine kinase [Azoarcus sp. L1K30]